MFSAKCPNVEIVKCPNIEIAKCPNIEFAKCPNIERVDRLVQSIAANKGLSLATVDRTVALVDSWIEKNQEKA